MAKIVSSEENVECEEAWRYFGNGGGGIMAAARKQLKAKTSKRNRANQRLAWQHAKAKTMAAAGGWRGERRSGAAGGSNGGNQKTNSA